MILNYLNQSIYNLKFNVALSMRYVHLIISLVFLFFIAANTNAQQPFNYPFRHITQQDGLLHNDVYSITQDDKGYIWIAGLNGIQRYDGVNFVNYTSALINPAESFVPGGDMIADKKNKLLLVYTSSGFQKKQFSENRFTFYNPENLLIDSASSFTHYQEKNNQQWLLGQDAAYYFDSVSNKYVPYCQNFVPENKKNTSPIVTDSSTDNTWIAIYPQLYLFDKKNKKIWSSLNNPQQHPLLQSVFNGKSKNTVRFVMIDHLQNIWVTTWYDNLYRYDNTTKKVSTYSLAATKAQETNKKTTPEGLMVSYILEDDNHTIWLATENAGLLRYNPEKNNFDYCIAQEKNSNGIQYNYKINRLFQDKEQNIWVSTDKGISIFNPYRQYFNSIRYEENSDLTIPKNEIVNIIKTTAGSIFIGTYGGGITEYDKQFRFKKNTHFKGLWQYNKVWSFQQLDDKTIWIGCQHGYLHMYDILTGATKTLQPPEMEKKTIRCMEKDNKGNIFFGLHSGEIVKWDKQLQKFFTCRDSFKIPEPVINIYIDKARHCWVSTAQGFKEFDPEKMIYTNTWPPDKNNTTSISSKYCQGIEELNDSTLLIGTIYGGLNFFNKRTKIFSHLTTADGLPSNTIYALKKDTAGHIWFTTDYGLYKFNPASKKFIPYSMEAGLIKSSFTANHFYPLQDGQWLTFTATEAISFSPYKAAHPDNLNPKIEITGFNLFNKAIFIDSLLNENKPVRLSYKENFFTIEFAVLNFSGVQQTNYYYRLTGIDKDWVNNGTKRFAGYTDLKPGEYIFEVKAEQAESSGEITSFKITITPPFWKTWWFITFISFCTLFLIFLFIRGREKSFKAIAAEKLKVQQLNAEQYKSKLELEQIINYFSSSLIDKNKIDDVLWDTAKNLIGRIGFVDCMIYLWNSDKTKMIQKAGFGPKGSVEEITKQHFDVMPGQGVVGYVMQTNEAVLIPDTSKDNRYRPDEMVRLSEISVPVMYNNELLGVIDCEHHEKNFFTAQHLQILNTIATLMANKIKSIEAEQSLQQSHIEMYSMHEQLSKAKLEALQSQMNPHFIFNCINSIDALIQSNDKYHATVYLNKFAKLIRNILDNSKQDTISLTKDLETLKLYIEMEQFRHENKFMASIKADDVLLQDDYKVPPLIVQPYIENAIIHGLRNKEGNEGILTVEIKKMDDKIQYTITDNGIGRAAAEKIMQNKESHYGMQMSYDRIKLFNKEEKPSVQVIDLYKDDIATGTEVKVLLNIM
jgi:ligand-binding sensor domain-containing protein/putative methionine-R-sulfoxide reductase with GAF domain